MCPELEVNLAQVQPTLRQTDRVDEGWKLRSYSPRWLRKPLSQPPLRTRTKSRFCVGNAQEIGLSNEDLGVSTTPCKGLGNNRPPAYQRQH
jgi:hypothetical protein